MTSPVLKLSEPPEPGAPREPARTPDPITAWLDTLGAVMKLPRHERDSVREELAGHLHDRVRDLMLSGVPESHASQQAIAELGDAAKLAHRLRAASRSPARRIAMNLSVFGIAGAALVTSLVALRGGAPTQPQPAAVMPQLTKVPDQVEKVRLTTDPQTTWGDLAKQIEAKAGMPVEVRWRALQEAACGPEQKLPAVVKDQDLPTALHLLSDESGSIDDHPDFRVRDGRLILGTANYFDQQETELVAYDLSRQAAERARDQNTSSLEANKAVTDEVRQLIEQMVHSSGWADMGGTMGSMAVFGSTMFIKAPKRYHTEIQWLVGQLPAGPAVPRAAIAPSAPPAAGAGGAALAPVAPGALPALKASLGVPILKDVPLLHDQFRTTVPLEPAVGHGPMTIKAADGSQVEVTGQAGSLKAEKVEITPGQPAPPTGQPSASPTPPPQGP